MASKFPKLQKLTYKVLGEPPSVAKNVFEQVATRNAYEILGQSAHMNDDDFLDKVSRACFEFFWHEASPITGITADNLNRPVTYSTASIGFGLSAMIVAAERGYRSRSDIEQRVETTMESLSKTLTKDGMFYHFLDENSQPTTDGYETAISTVDTGLLLMGAITVGEYFGGKIKDYAEQLLEQCNWSAFTDHEHKQVFMAWEPDSKEELDGIGKFHPVRWDYFSDEAMICNLLGSANPNKDFALPAEYFYHWERNKGQYHPATPGYESTDEFVYSYSGALFTYQFAHLWVNFQELGADQPQKFNLPDVPAINWYDNSSAATQAAWLVALDNAQASKTYGPFGWGFTAHTSLQGYNVGAILPRGEQNLPFLLNGEIAPYGAGTCIMFDPEKVIKTLRYYYGLQDDSGKKVVWNDSDHKPYGFYDAFNLDNGYVAQQYLGIDLGPMLLAIENHRSGLIQKTFMKNKHIQRSLKAIGFANLSQD
ncbi:glucoamylase family protein [Lentisphaera profundi]|uniref:Glucoamylase family protein n=1 Tax=Lentisphaera profundi TaxID=1658616 RepID=A0ABY7VV27_9BACT|nr:glucoamylase family protein [Lentisphaera profundi]WDE98073.1 glucoamylase family protein [Lentisphaera profundi]